MVLRGVNVEGPLTEAEAQARAEKLARMRQEEQEFREASQVVNNGGEPEQLRQALTNLVRIAFGETALAEGYVNNARQQLRGLGLEARPTDEQLAAVLERLQARQAEQRQREQANQEAQRLFQEANRLERQGRAEEAKVLQDELLAKYPETPYARAIQVRRAQPGAAVGGLELAQPQPPDVFRVQLRIARELLANHRTEEARAVLERLKARQPPPELAEEIERLLQELAAHEVGAVPPPTRPPPATDIF
jgi:hypothetical protein